MGPAEHALYALVDGGLRLPFAQGCETRVPTHDETLWLVQEYLAHLCPALPVDGVLVRAQALHGKGSYVVDEEG
jgi:hypothetical protein